MQKLSRREALRGTGLAALAAGAAVVPITGLSANPVSGTSDFAALVTLYFSGQDEVRRTRHNTDEEFDTHAAATYDAALFRMAKTPIRTSEDALALLDWMTREDVIEYWIGDAEGVVEAMVESLRAYLHEVRS